MCTVTLTPLRQVEKGFVLTSNRDEASGRKTLAPSVYMEQGVRMLYPRDEVAGGTWIGVSERQRCICLLNGAFEKHDRNPPYRKSRGVVVRELLAAVDLQQNLEESSFFNIEPFTIIGVDWKKALRFVQFVWDGEEKHFEDLEIREHIWSSSPLYTSQMKRERQEWFAAFREEHISNPESLWKFHTTGGVGDPERDLIMDRSFVKTQSITQITNSGNGVTMLYNDLLEGKMSETVFNF